MNQKFIDIKQNIQKRSLTTASAVNSIVAGVSSTNVYSGSSLSITVTAKDSNGNLITTGGEIFTVKISNLWTKYNNYYWNPSGATSPLYSNINGVMTDNNDGTYIYTFTLTSLGKFKHLLYFNRQCFNTSVFIISQRSVSRVLWQYIIK